VEEPAGSIVESVYHLDKTGNISPCFKKVAHLPVKLTVLSFYTLFITANAT
jgi:hypothetical protein